MSSQNARNFPGSATLIASGVMFNKRTDTVMSSYATTFYDVQIYCSAREGGVFTLPMRLFNNPINGGGGQLTGTKNFVVIRGNVC
jgi:hypothetical protein